MVNFREDLVNSIFSLGKTIGVGLVGAWGWYRMWFFVFSLSRNPAEEQRLFKYAFNIQILIKAASLLLLISFLAISIKIIPIILDQYNLVSFPIFTILKKNDMSNSLKNLFISFLIPLIFLVLISLQGPLILLITIIFFSCVPALQFFTNISFLNISEKSKKIINLFLDLLFVVGITNIAFHYYCFLNNKLTVLKFKLIIAGIFLWFFGYILVIRYILFLKINNLPLSIGIMFLYVIFSFSVIIRGFTSFSLFLIPFIFNHYPEKGLLLMPPFDEGNNNGNKFFGFMPKHNHNHYYYPPNSPKFGFYRGATLCLGICGLGISAFACTIYNKAAIAAEIQAKAAERQADQWEVSRGIRSEEDYLKKYPIQK